MSDVRQFVHRPSAALRRYVREILWVRSIVPGIARLKEWAYVGFGITILSASYSHLPSGDGFLALEPLVTFAALILSYTTRPPSRTFFNPAFNPAPTNAISRRDATQANEHQPIVSLEKA